MTRSAHYLREPRPKNGRFGVPGLLRMAQILGVAVVVSSVSLLVMSFVPASGATTQTITITSTAPGPQLWSQTYTPTATASSGLTVAITLATTDTTTCSISGGVVTFNAAGTCQILFNQAGDSTFSAAAPKTQNVLVGPTPTSGQSGSPAAVTITPADGGSVVQDPTSGDNEFGTGLQVNVSGHGFEANTTLKIQECAENDNSTLPVDDTTCDGNTVQHTVTDARGNFTLQNFTIYSLPSSTLGETSPNGATCDLGHPCTLYVGENQNTFVEAPGSYFTFTDPFVMNSNANDTITFTSTAPTNVAIGSTYTPTATATSGDTPAITIDSSASSVCSIAGGVVTFNAAGNCLIDANDAPPSNLDPAPQVTQSIVVGSSQTIDITSTAPTNAQVGGTYTPTAAATGSSGLTVAITIDSSASSVCSIAGGVVTFIAAGNCVIDFDLPATSTSPPAHETQTVVVGKQTITPSAPPTNPQVGGTYSPTASASSGLPVTITIDTSTSGNCSISGTSGSVVVTFNLPGTCQIDFSQAGSSKYLAAQTTQPVTVPSPPSSGTLDITADPCAPTNPLKGCANLPASVPANWFFDGEAVTLSAPSGLFSGTQNLNIYECPDPGGDPTQLKADLSKCVQDAGTITANTTQATSTGGVSDGDYVMTQPGVLGVLSAVSNLCDGLYCVIFVGPQTAAQPLFNGKYVLSAPFRDFSSETALVTALPSANTGNTGNTPGPTTSTAPSGSTTTTTATSGSAPLPPGAPSGTYGTPVSVTVAAGAATTVSSSANGVSATVTIPSGALPAGTIVSLAAVTNPSALKKDLPKGHAYVVSYAVSWAGPNGTVPTASPSATLNITDSAIVAGDVYDQLTTSGLKSLGSAKSKGKLAISFTTDPAFVVMTATSSAKTTAAHSHSSASPGSTVSGSPVSSSGASDTGGTSAAGSTLSDSGTAASGTGSGAGSSSSLAYTGAPRGAIWLCFVGLGMILIGSVGRRRRLQRGT